MRRHHLDQFLDIAGAGFPHRLPVEHSPGQPPVTLLGLGARRTCWPLRVRKTRPRILLFQPPGSQFEHQAAEHLQAEFIAVTHHLFHFVEDPLVRFGVDVIPVGPDANQVELVLFGNGFEHGAALGAGRIGGAVELRPVEKALRRHRVGRRRVKAGGRGAGGDPQAAPGQADTPGRGPDELSARCWHGVCPPR